MKFIATQTSLKSGRLSRKLDGRIDIAEYKHGCRKLDNMVVLPEGGARKIGGVYADNDNTVNGSPLLQLFQEVVDSFFKLNENVYKLRVYTSGGDLEFRIYDDSGTLAGTFSKTGVDDPYAVETAVFDNALYFVVGGGIRPFRVYEDSTGSLVKDEYLNPGVNDHLKVPYKNAEIDGNKLLKVSGSGTTIELVDASGTVIASADNICNYVDVNEHLFVVGIATVGGDKQVHSNYYQVTGRNVILGNVTVVPVYGSSGGSSDYLLEGATEGTFQEWAYPAWGVHGGWPTKIVSADSRLIFANTVPGFTSTPKASPLGVFGSAVGSPDLMSNKRLIVSGAPTNGFTYFSTNGSGIVNTDPFNFTLSTKHDTEIRFLENARNFIVGTDARVYVDKSSGLLGPLNVDFSPDVSAICDGPVTSFGSDVFFSANGGKDLMQFRYSEDNGSFIAKQISLLNDDLYDNTAIKQLDFNNDINSLLVLTDDERFHSVTVTRESGVMAYTTYEDFQNVKSFTYNRFTNRVHMCQFESTQAGIYTSTWDMSEGLTTLKDYLTDRILWQVFPATSTLIYPFCSPGDEVWWVDASDETNFGKVTAGVNGSGTPTVTFPDPLTLVWIGKAVKGVTCLMPVEAGQQYGSAQMAMKRVDNVGVRVYDSYSYKFKELNSGFEEQVTVSPDGVTPTSGQFIRPLSSSASDEAVICISNEEPEPFTLCSVSLRGLSNDG